MWLMQQQPSHLISMFLKQHPMFHLRRRLQ
jgi:hypothetical protein